MQIEKKPFRWKVIGAQILAYLLTLIAAIIMLLSFLWNSSILTNWLLIGVIIFFVPGALLAVTQLLLMRKWLPLGRSWILVSGIAMLLLLFGEYFLFTRFIINLVAVHDFTFVGGYTAWYAIQPIIVRWSLFSGLLLGFLGGLLFGIIQALFLPWHRRLWWAVSAMLWGLIGAAFLVFLNVMPFLIYLALP